MTKAVFLDRDGVIIKERGEYTYRLKDVEMIDGIVEFLKEIKKRNFKIIVITNQGGIAKGLFGYQEVYEVHKLIKSFLEGEGAKIDDIFFCPHHDKFCKCLCRKPGTLLIEKAMAIYKIDAALSFFVGDRERDMEAAISAGVYPVKIESNENLMNYLDVFTNSKTT